jgi:23S rRNA pseudouridine1911/1915/1917 synthase
VTFKTIPVPTDHPRTQRVGQFIAEQEGVSVRLASSWCHAGRVKDTRHHRPLKKGDLVPPQGVLIMDEAVNASPQHAHLDITFENENILVLNKPAGLPTLPKNLSDTTGDCIARRLQARYAWAEILRQHDSGLCHRLDNDTSGLLLVAKTQTQQETLRRQWQGIQKGYIALVEGHLDTVQSIELPMAHHPTASHKMMTVSAQETGRGQTRRAQTLFYPMSYSNGCSLVAAFLKSRGNRHQIRVHAKAMGMPLIGDRLYGGAAHQHLPGQALHAAMITLPGQPPLFCPCPEGFVQTAAEKGFSPADFKAVLDNLMNFSRK